MKPRLAAPSRGGGALAALLAVASLANLAFVWGFPHFISQDGPAHVYNAWVMLHYDAPAFGPFRDVFRISLEPVPNLLDHLLLIGLLSVTGPVAAEKLLVSLYIVLWPLSWCYALRGVRRGGEWVALLAMPLCMSWFLHMGFYNFCFSLEGMLLVLGWWLRRRRRPTVPRLCVLAILMSALYFTHLVSLVELWIAMAGVECCAALLLGRRTGLRGLARSLARSTAWAAAAAPCLALVAAFLRQSDPSSPAAHFRLFEVLPEKLAALAGPFPSLMAFNYAESAAALVIHVFLGAAVAIALATSLRRRSRLAPGLILAAVLMALAYLAAPSRLAGGEFVLQRLVVYPYFALLLWLASARPGRIALRAAQALGTGLALLILVVRLPVYSGLVAQEREYLSVFDAIPPGSTVLPVTLTLFPIDPGGDGRLPWIVSQSMPLRHVASLASVQRRLINLGNYEAGTTHFPLRWRSGMQPDVIGNIGEPFPMLTLAAYPSQTGRQIDAVTVWDNGGSESLPGPRDRLMPQLRASFRPVAKTAPFGYGELWLKN